MPRAFLFVPGIPGGDSPVGRRRNRVSCKQTKLGKVGKLGHEKKGESAQSEQMLRNLFGRWGLAVQAAAVVGLLVAMCASASAQVEVPHQRVLDRQFAEWTGAAFAGMTLDGYTTVDGWSHGCYEGNSPSNSRGKVIAQLTVEAVVVTALGAFIKWDIQRTGATEARWAWKIPGVIIGALHAGAAANNIRIGCA
jgi:hypothetical protein